MLVTDWRLWILNSTLGLTIQSRKSTSNESKMFQMKENENSSIS